MGGRAIPDWPRMLRRATAAAYCDLTAAEFEREIADGRVPLPVIFGGSEHWSRVLLDEALERLTGEQVPDWRQRTKLYAKAR